jgi:hypothetical protein
MANRASTKDSTRAQISTRILATQSLTDITKTTIWIVDHTSTVLQIENIRSSVKMVKLLMAANVLRSDMLSRVRRIQIVRGKLMDIIQILSRDVENIITVKMDTKFR